MMPLADAAQPWVPRPAPRTLLPALVGALVVSLTPAPAGSQSPSRAQVQQAVQQAGMADVVRHEMQASGLTPSRS